MQRKSTAVILTLLLVLTAAFSAVQTANAKQLERKRNGDLLRSFYELTENVEKIDTALLKAALSLDSHSLIKSASEIRAASAFAISDLSELSNGDEGSGKITEFLNLAADYSKAAALVHSDGSGVTGEESKTFSELSRHASELKATLEEIRAKVASGQMTLSEAEKAVPSFDGAIEKAGTDALSDFGKPSYRGPFSEHENTLGTVMLDSVSVADEKTALKKAMECLGGRVVLVKTGETDGLIASYVFSGDAANTHYSVEISKRGAMPLSMTSSRVFGDDRITESECASIAKEYAASIGYKNLLETYRTDEGQTVTFNFAPEEGGVIMYPDLVKVQVAKDTGSVTGFSADGYLLNHRERGLGEPAIDAADLDSGGRFDEKNARLCVISTEYSGEMYCWEFPGSIGERNFYVYINADTARQEEILFLN